MLVLLTWEHGPWSYRIGVPLLPGAERGHLLSRVSWSCPVQSPFPHCSGGHSQRSGCGRAELAVALSGDLVSLFLLYFFKVRPLSRIAKTETKWLNSASQMFSNFKISPDSCYLGKGKKELEAAAA